MLLRFSAWLMLALATCFQHNPSEYRFPFMRICLSLRLTSRYMPSQWYFYSLAVTSGRIYSGHSVVLPVEGPSATTKFANLISRSAFSRSRSATSMMQRSRTTQLSMYCGECTPGRLGKEGDSGCSNKSCTCHTTGVCTCVACTCGPACPCQTSKKSHRLPCGCTEIARCSVHA
jgi:hypothetical protein